MRRIRTAANRRAIIAAAALLRPSLLLARSIGPDRASDLGGGLTRAVGPFLRAHRIAEANLAAAFREKSSAERERILRGSWDNFGRTCGEFANLHRLWDGVPAGVVPDRIIIDPADLERARAMAQDQNGSLLFSAHLANWELAAVAAVKLGIDLAILFRPPEVPAVASLVSKIRSPSMGRLIASSNFAPVQMFSELQRGTCIAALQDQPEHRGVDVTFFNRPIKAMRLIAHLARLTERPIHGARVIRLPDRCFRIELTPPIKVAREPGGKIDVQGTTQVITSIIEGWIREYPDQWLWQAHLFDRL